MRKCPICKKEKEMLLCPNCGFDESLDYRNFRVFSRLSVKSRENFSEKEKKAEQKKHRNVVSLEDFLEKKAKQNFTDRFIEERECRKLAVLIGETPENDLKKLGVTGSQMQQFRKAGISVPNGFVLTTDAWKEYGNKELWGKSLNWGLMKLAMKQKKVLGDSGDPLIFSVHADGWDWKSDGVTIQNVGLNDETVKELAKKSGDAWMAWDSYRRLIKDFAVKLHGVEEDFFLLAEEALLRKKGKKSLTKLGAEEMMLLAQEYKTLYNLNILKPFPQKPSEQLQEVIQYFYEKGEKERENRQLLNDLPEGTAILIQTMVFGNRQVNSCSGCVRIGDLSDHLGTVIRYRELSGDFVDRDQMADKESIVDGNFYDQVFKLEKLLPGPYTIDFTVENGTCYFLSAKKIKKDTFQRLGKMSPTEEVRNICKLVDEGKYTEKQAAKVVSEKTLEKAVTEGLELGCVTRIRYWKEKYNLTE